MASLMGIRAVDKAHRNAGKIKVVRSLASNQAEIFIRKFASFTFEIEELFRFFSLFKILSPNIIRWNRLLFNSTVNILSDSLLTAPRSGRNPSDSEQIYAFNLLFSRSDSVLYCLQMGDENVGIFFRLQLRMNNIFVFHFNVILKRL